MKLTIDRKTSNFYRWLITNTLLSILAILVSSIIMKLTYKGYLINLPMFFLYSIVTMLVFDIFFKFLTWVE